MKVIISKEEKALIKAYVSLKFKKCGGLDSSDSDWLENNCTKIIDNRNGEYRYMVEDFITELINKLNN